MATACVQPPAGPKNDTRGMDRLCLGETASAPFERGVAANPQAMVLAQMQFYRQLFFHTPLTVLFSGQSVIMETTLALMRAQQQSWLKLMMRPPNLKR